MARQRGEPWHDAHTAAPDETPSAVPDDLVYVQDHMPGIQRHRRGKGFAYQAEDGHWLQARHPQDRLILDRIKQLAIPPAYEDVWICPLDNGHLQATGRDAKGRKQYRYHAQWHEARGSDKFARMLEFGRALPRLRRRVKRDLAHKPPAPPPLQREVLLASLVRLLDTACVRIGNESYARANKSFGLTTLRNRHAQVEGPTIKLRFRGKSGVSQEVAMQDPTVARIVRKCQALPGQMLFQYEDEQGLLHPVGSTEVNAYIREACGDEAFSAKDFRTWHATVHTWSLLAPSQHDQTPLTAAQIKEVLACVAARLGNTVAVCRKSYVHPGVLACAVRNEWPDLDDVIDSTESRKKSAPSTTGLNAAERGLLAFLQAR